MKNRILLFLLILNSCLLTAQKTGEELLKLVHKKYYQCPCKSYSFSQKNTHYKGDTISGRSEWHEVIEFPDKFVIHFGDKKAGNYVLFRHDSAYNFKNGKLMRSRADSNTLLLLLGGMFYRNFEDVAARINKAGFNTKILSENSFNAKKVFVIGAQPSDTTTNQVWIEKDTWRVVRILEKMDNSEVMDLRFESFQKWCKGYVETKVSFRRNGKLEQTEEYYDLKMTDAFPKILYTEKSD